MFNNKKKKPPNTIQRSPREWNLSFPIFQGSRDFSPPRSKESKAVYIQISLSLSLYSFPPSFLSFLDIESCVYMPHAEREGERLAPQTGHEAPSNVSQSSHSQVAFRPVWKSLDPFACALFLFENFSTTCVQIAIRHRQQQSTRVLLFFGNNSATNTPQRLFPSTPKKNRPLLFGNNHLNFGHGYFFQKEIIETNFNHWKTFFDFYFQPVLFI